MKKRILFLLSFVLIFTQISFADGFKHPNSVWSLFEKEKTLNKDDKNAVIQLEKEIISLYENLDMSLEVSSVLCPRYKTIALAYFDLKDFENAKLYLTKHLDLTNLRMSSYGLDETDNVLDAKAMLQNLDITPKVYAFSSNSDKQVFYGSRLEPKSGTYFGRVVRDGLDIVEKGMENESAILIYVEFLEEKIQDYNLWFEKYKQEGKLIELAWNFPQKMKTCEVINSGVCDEMIDESLIYLNSLNTPIILRIGAEQNAWLSTNPEIYKKAYIRIAKRARELAPNIALSFSLNFIGDRQYDYLDYYPGDEYVDWVGVSLYCNKYFNKVGETDQEQMVYGTGKYSNPINLIRPVVEKFASKKPIMISEGAIGHKFKKNGEDLTDYAKEVLNNYYTALPMVYPQIKLMVYFDKNIESSKVNYKLSDKSSLNELYNRLSSNLPMYIQKGENKAGSYIEIDKLNEKIDGKLNLGTYLDYVKYPNTEVSYYVNDKMIGDSLISPSTKEIELSEFNEGDNSLSIVFKNANGFEKKLFYKVSKSNDYLKIDTLNEKEAKLLEEKKSDASKEELSENSEKESPVKSETVGKSTESKNLSSEEKLKVMIEGGFVKPAPGAGLEDPIKRVESLVFIIRVMGKEKEALALNDDEVESILSTVEDEKLIQNWARKYIAYAIKEKITLGVGSKISGMKRMDPNSMSSTKVFLTMLLRTLSYSDVEPENVYEKSKLAGLKAEYTDNKIHLKQIKRKEMAVLIYDFINNVKMPNSEGLSASEKELKTVLLDNEVISSDFISKYFSN